MHSTGSVRVGHQGEDAPESAQKVYAEVILKQSSEITEGLIMIRNGLQAFHNRLMPPTARGCDEEAKTTEPSSDFSCQLQHSQSHQLRLVEEINSLVGDLEAFV